MNLHQIILVLQILTPLADMTVMTAKTKSWKRQAHLPHSSASNNQCKPAAAHQIIYQGCRFKFFDLHSCSPSQKIGLFAPHDMVIETTIQHAVGSCKAEYFDSDNFSALGGRAEKPRCTARANLAGDTRAFCCVCNLSLRRAAVVQPRA